MNPFDTHEVLNQAPPFQDVDLYDIDLALQEGLVREGGTPAADIVEGLRQLGRHCGSREAQELARLANIHGPRLVGFDRAGRRVDEIEFHPAWHALMTLLVEAGAHAAPWSAPQPGAHVARAAAYLLFGQLENGAQCPVTMTYASVAALRRAPALASLWLPKILAREYDPRPLPIEHKRGALIGMGMTEKQGGSDVRSNTTRATALAPGEVPDGCALDGAPVHRIVGHKWFFSVPQADAHLILARQEDAAPGVLSCFLVPRFLPSGEHNAVRVQRLKDKLGNRSNASSEAEFCGAIGWLVGEAGRGIPTILEMGSLTRLDCVLGSAGILRAALCHALHHARGRSAFGRALSEQPLMQNVLADLALESEAATALALRLARCVDQAGDPDQALLGRILTPAAKYWVCKRGPAFGAEAVEVMGGNGYVEDGPLARLYRELPVNSIWEGSGNVMCLDVLRAIGKSPLEARAVLERELLPAAHLDARFAAHAEMLLESLGARAADEFGARRLAEDLVLALQGALLLQHAPAPVAAAFVASRIAAAPGGAFGRLPAQTDCAAILARALPL